MTEIVVRYYVFKNDLRPKERHVKILKTANIERLENVIGQSLNAEGRITLWKSKKNTGNTYSDLLERLHKAQNVLSKVCDELSDWEATVGSLVSASSFRSAKIPMLIAEILEQPRVNRDPSEESDLQSESGELVGMMRAQFRQTVTNVRSGPTPSLSAQPRNYIAFQNGTTPITDGRYGKSVNDPGIPVELFHPAFAEFRSVANDNTQQPPLDLIELTLDFMRGVARISTDEASRQGFTRRMLAEIISVGVVQTVNSNKSSADHIVLNMTHGAAALAVIEEKPELGHSGEGSVQGSFSYLQHWSDVQQEPLSLSCFCPSFIVSVAGPWISICGAVFTTKAVVQRLTDYIWLGNGRAIDDINTLRIARILLALRRGIASLSSFYDSLEIRNTAARFFPLATSFPQTLGDGSIALVRFQYLEPLKGIDSSCLAFLAINQETHERYVVKFVEQYGQHAHRLLADSNDAPKLLHCGSVWGDDGLDRGCQPRKMVVMEYVPGEVLAKKATSVVRSAVESVIQKLHSANLVHGDIRQPNILIAEGSGAPATRVKILDFDWAGIEGETKYPLNLSKMVDWAAGVRDYALIKKAHDLEMVSKL
ncbi:hypothetical protein CYLTODRAFT_440083 [Cylindrobasidium torrendii FP15055 ss-10]|uniref:Protein kinase domain-containing protein n=1 Tax=Cylindrobasidium torrendii FP15055 ss-10 TaxID=1314674 RepID=A0A0D7BSQ4_9AGAR|nr:hypothetical protein CYLTODRAFT_440083 [Cylindrobasidium torrendii FP15055 ss-10]